MIFNTILILILNFISTENIDHIKDFEWNNRVLIVKDNGKINFSKKINFNKKNFDQRDFIIIYLREENAFIYNKKMSKYFSNSVLKKIRNTKSEHNLFLIGKDGQVKKSYSSEVDLERIFNDVDKMPMRKIEMLKQK